MTHRLQRRALPLLGLAWALGLAGCASPQATQLGPWTRGRLLLRVAEQAGAAARADTLAFELRGDARRGELRLETPLGLRAAELRWTPEQAWLIDAQGERPFPSLDMLSREVLGQPLPLAALPDWLAGRPWPQATHRPLAHGFEQLGWQVDTAALAAGRIEARRELPAPALLVRVLLAAP